MLSNSINFARLQPKQTFALVQFVNSFLMLSRIDSFYFVLRCYRLTPIDNSGDKVHCGSYTEGGDKQDRK
jgi:hypothetical protein